MAAILLFFFCMLFTVTGVTTYTPVFITDVYELSVSIGGLEIRQDSVANLYFSALLISGAISQLVVSETADVYDNRAVLVGLLGTSALSLTIVSTVLLGPVALFCVLVFIDGSLFGLYLVRNALISDITPLAYEGRTFRYVWTAALLVSSVYPFFIGYLGDSIGLQASFGTLAIAALFGMICIGMLYSSHVYDGGSAGR